MLRLQIQLRLPNLFPQFVLLDIQTLNLTCVRVLLNCGRQDIRHVWGVIVPNWGRLLLLLMWWCPNGSRSCPRWHNVTNCNQNERLRAFTSVKTKEEHSHPNRSRSFSFRHWQQVKNSPPNKNANFGLDCCFVFVICSNSNPLRATNSASLSMMFRRF